MINPKLIDNNILCKGCNDYYYQFSSSDTNLKLSKLNNDYQCPNCNTSDNLIDI